ncbi:isochorismatase family protein [Bacillus infantis]|uniref:isochorismatase family protein n=1 Tax=Bacillus infantis TaxID=324767 RepID=UPI0020A1D503|nr:isochorismatase family protein [Bacillus infantis]MCP1158626.1 isochorismatase family protein [Bacillus infantis]
MEALLVIDVQNGIVTTGDFSDELQKMEKVIMDFKDRGRPVIFLKHLDGVEESPLYEKGEGAEIIGEFADYPDYVIDKRTPSAFFETNLAELLQKMDVEKLVITGFNTEFCCLFTSISAYDRGYKVTFIEDATGTVNKDETYEMPGLDNKDFIGTVLHWSDVIEVLDFEEYEEIYLKVTES